MSEYSARDSGDIILSPFHKGHKAEVIHIYNHYIRQGTAAFPMEPVEEDFFDFLLEMPECYPVFVLLDTRNDRVVGFCFLSPFHPLPTFGKTANIDYFIAPGYTGKGLGSLCLERLEAEAKKAGISHIVADVSGENRGSIAFHQRHGFRHCGVLTGVGSKLGRDFDVVYMQKDV